MCADIDSKLISQYEGLVKKTASLTVEHCEEDFDDICQLFRVKVWKALLSFDPTQVKDAEAKDKHGRTAQDRYVYMCVKNMAKDLVKRVRRNIISMEQMVQEPGGDFAHDHRISHDNFTSRYLSVAEDQVFQEVEEAVPLIPSTLDARERRIATLLYLDFDNGEIGQQLGIQRKQVATIVRGMREKLADWAPPGWEQPTSARRKAPPLRPVPRPEPMPIAA
jgi:RNA polymerase sigma factor (sigma-70 family)